MQRVYGKLTYDVYRIPDIKCKKLIVGQASSYFPIDIVILLMYNLEKTPQKIYFCGQMQEREEINRMIMSRADCIKQFGSDYFIRKKLNSGELHRIDKGIFTDDIFVPELAIISYKYPNSVVTMISAFYRYGLTDKIPDKIDLATDRDASKISDSRVRQYFTPKGLFTLGVTTIQERGYELQIYNLERMLIELLRYKSKLPFDLYKEILLNYRKIMHQLDIQLIQDYALSAPKSNMILNSLQLEVL